MHFVRRNQLLKNKNNFIGIRSYREFELILLNDSLSSAFNQNYIGISRLILTVCEFSRFSLYTIMHSTKIGSEVVSVARWRGSRNLASPLNWPLSVSY